MRKYNNIIFLTLILSLGNHCLANKNNDSLFVKRTCDSLKKSQCDTILIFKKYCDYCLAVNFEEWMDSTTRATSSAPGPVTIYIFWVKKGKYYVKKHDQEGNYKTLMRNKWTEFPIYDHYFRNHKLIDEGENPMNLMEPEVRKLFIDTWNGKLDPDRYFKRVKSIVSRDPLKESSNTYISLIIKKKKETELFLEDNIYLPMSTDPEFQNNEQLYYYMFMTKVAEWKRIIESELFETEAKHLWVKE